MPEERRLEGLDRRKTLLRECHDTLRNRVAVLWGEADRPIFAFEQAVVGLRRVHPAMYGAAGIALFAMRRKVLPRRHWARPLLSIGWIILETPVNRRKRRP